ncbi:hypothetical protein KM176_14255 [Pseudooceanicola sp. CBS1P-1]|uniref:Uncharacterized protein n=1 Tax=Pseudooceanicola albus TaxID=2692189 RepID=A0A6L7G394_9RHOB|nr:MULTISPECIES: hypothetical protein [Pseudooceanicola]MBT9385028.1 hypothetical protein [Pseudooceanicola endophyticus]MXN17978.1 hypothetical protein [Pseudooceanicola albus]
MEPLLLLSAGVFTVPDYDKQLHYLSGAALSVLAEQQQMTPLQTCLFSLGAGLAKEAWDSTGRGDVEMADVAATSFVGCHVRIRF